MKALALLRALNHARRAASGTPAAGATEVAADMETAIDAADRAGGFDRRKNRVQSPPKLDRRLGPHRIGCRCLACNIQRRWRARRAERAFEPFDPRPVVKRCSALRGMP